MHCPALTKPVTDCRRSSSSSFSDKLLLSFTSAFRDVAPHCRTEICQQLDFIVIIAGRLILIMGRIFTGISQTIRYRPSLLMITHYQTLKSFQSQQIHAETCAMLLGDDWQMKTMCVLKSAENIKHVWYPPTGWNQSLKLKNQSLWALYTTRFSVESVKSNLQTGSDCQQLASTSPDCKSEENWGKNCVFKGWSRFSNIRLVDLIIEYQIGRAIIVLTFPMFSVLLRWWRIHVGRGCVAWKSLA